MTYFWNMPYPPQMARSVWDVTRVEWPEGTGDHGDEDEE